MDEIGLFPLGIVLLPGERVPLHIFEPRYRELIGECLERSVPFGLVFADESGMRGVGTEAAVVEVSHRFEDGRLNIVVEGRKRFQLVQLTGGRSFTTAEVAALPDEGDEPAPAELERSLAAYRALAVELDLEPRQLDTGAGGAAFQIAASVDFGVEAKQRLLELRSERERVLLLSELLERATAAVRNERALRERASTNGRVTPT